jgi:hypothetical protein
MTLITLQDGKVVMRNDKVGTEQACCCGCRVQIAVGGQGFCGLTEDNPYFDPNDGTCDAIKAARDYLKELYELAGWVVTIVDSTQSEQTQTECNSPFDCFYELSATCGSDMCWLFSTFGRTGPGNEILSVPEESLLDDSLFLPVSFPEGSSWIPNLATQDYCCDPPSGVLTFPFDSTFLQQYVPICQNNPFP